jgi:small conductance mechanosensitive channel
VDFLVRVWVDAGDYFQYKADMTRKVKEALDAEGVDIPFPTRTLLQPAAPEPESQQDAA